VSKGESATATQNGLSEKSKFDPIAEEKSWQAITGKNADSNTKTQAETQKMIEESLQDNATNFPLIYTILIILCVFLLLAAVTLVLVIVSRKYVIK